jgi:gliding motility-associated-like protein
MTYCLNETASQLTAGTTPGNTVLWYNNSALTGGGPTAPTPNTSSAATTAYYVTQTNSYSCISQASSISVTVNPKITGNTIGNDQTICTNTTPANITSQATITGGNNSFTYQWQQSTDGGLAWTNITAATTVSYSPGSLSSSIQYRRIVKSSVCSDTSNVVTITVQGTLTNIDVTGPQTICSGSIPSLLIGQSPAGGNGSFTYQWESSGNGSTWSVINGETGADYQPTSLTSTTYFRRLTKSGPCSGYSSSVLITVNPIPAVNAITDKIYCNGSSVTGINFISIPNSGISYSWTNDNIQIGLTASGTGTIPSFTATNTNTLKEPLVANVSVTPTYTNAGKSCTGNAGNFKVIVLPTINVAPINNETICTNVTAPSYTPTSDAGDYQGSSVSYGWAVSGTGITLTNGSGLSIPSFKGINNGTTDLVATITVTPKYSYGGLTCDGTPTDYTVTVKPGTPAATAGPDALLCAVDTYTMRANQPSSATGTWTQIGSATAVITNSSSATTNITGLVPGNSYKFEWSLTGFASCPDTKDTVVISIDPDIVNTIATNAQTTCFGGQIVVNGDLPTGGNGTYSYQWQQSTDNVTWVNIAGATGVSLTFIPAQSIYVKRIVTSLPCKNESLPAQIIVQPGITNNKISQDQSICINTPASTINGALPSGGDGVYSYQWEQSTNGGLTWTNIPGATAQDYAPGILTTTTKYRRLVSTILCSGPQSNTSNVVTITVNPDAKAVFNPTTNIGCIPFKITPAVINLQTYPLQNSQYLWYANNVLIGSGTTFPGYTMNNDNDTVTIKLIAVSAFGCLSDSVSHDFYTYETPQPSFTVSDTVGCGPLTAQINNTTPKINSFSYQWNFGNGQTSNVAQPGQITFLPNPNHRDTTYQIKLSVASACNTINAVQSVRVKSKPKALFAPDKSVGCSPMTVTFNNTSLGIGNNYTWDFGDGSTQVNTSNPSTVTHTFTTGVQDTFYVKLIAMNECGNDTLKYAIVVSPNQIHLDFAINGNQFSGCSPHAVQFVNNSSGATLFSWNFGDNNNINTTRNIDTVSHTYLAAGNYTVTLKATNGCSDTTSTETIVVFAKPKAKFAAIPITACIGDSIHFTNQSTGATSYLWNLGDGNSVALTNPVYKFSAPGTYTVHLVASSFNAPNTVCSDTISQPIQIVSSMPGSISVSDTTGYCAPFTVSFNNLNLPSTSATWDFGDGSSGDDNSVTHTYTSAGTYQVTLNVTVPGGCNYITKKTIKVLGPGGSWSHTTGYLCNNAAAYFQVVANNADSLIYQFGDGTVLTTTSNTVSHVYANGGSYLPSVTLKNKAGCLVPLQGIDSIKADKIKAGFRIATQQFCGYTVINFTDTTHVYFGKSKIEWLFGDGTTSTGNTATHTYKTTGNYPVKLIVTGNSGCADTLSTILPVVVYSKPVASIVADPVVCARYPVLLGSSVQSGDAINVTQWTLSNGVTSVNSSFNYSFNQAGNYTMQLIVGTVNGCYDTASSSIKVNPTPNVTASGDVDICRGSSTSLSANGTGVNEWNWFPQSGLSCTTCTNTIASPLVTTPYVIEGKNNFGCSAFDTVVVTVIQPLHMRVSPSDSICIGESTNLLASGASSYSWSPATGLNNTTLSNPTAAPGVTTSYRVVGYDGYNCFTDTAFVMVGVGQYPKVDLGVDLTLAAGTLQPLSSTIQNGPIRSWSWTPTANLSCANCALPIATIKKNTSYIVKVTTAYGCSATDTISIKVFCEDSQTFIPNAFTPDGDGINDILMVRGKGVVMVKSFRVYNRWGQVVFEKTDFAPNDPSYGWNGKINGVIGGPDVYVYTAEVMCENGATFTYKGNVSLIK